MSERINLSKFRSAIRSDKPFEISYDKEKTEERLKEWNPHHGFGSTPPWGAYGVYDISHRDRGGRLINIEKNKMQIDYCNLDAILHTPVLLKEVERMYSREDELVKLVEDLIYYIESKDTVQQFVDSDEVTESDIMTSLTKVAAMKMATEKYIYGRIRYVMDWDWTPKDDNQEYNLEEGMTKLESFVSSRLSDAMYEGLDDFDHDARYEGRYFDLAKANLMYCLTVRDVHNNGWADKYFFETLEEANSWSEAIFSLYDSKEGFEGYQWGITKVSLTKMTLNKFMEGYGLHRCGNTPIACPEYANEDHDYCHKCRS